MANTRITELIEREIGTVQDDLYRYKLTRDRKGYHGNLTEEVVADSIKRLEDDLQCLKNLRGEKHSYQSADNGMSQLQNVVRAVEAEMTRMVAKESMNKERIWDSLVDISDVLKREEAFLRKLYDKWRGSGEWGKHLWSLFAILTVAHSQFSSSLECYEEERGIDGGEK